MDEMVILMPLALCGLEAVTKLVLLTDALDPILLATMSTASCGCQMSCTRSWTVVQPTRASIGIVIDGMPPVLLHLLRRSIVPFLLPPRMSILHWALLFLLHRFYSYSSHRWYLDLRPWFDRDLVWLIISVISHGTHSWRSLCNCFSVCFSVRSCFRHFIMSHEVWYYTPTLHSSGNTPLVELCWGPS